MILETERLIIRKYTDEDLDDLCLFLMDKEQMYYIPESFESKTEVSEFMKKNRNSFYLVELKESEQVIGHLSFEAFFKDHSYEIGWVFNREYTGHGYAYEAAYRLMDYGFKELNIHRIIATAQPDNEASWKLMEKLQMRREAHFKACIPYKETWWDEYYYAILEEEWL